MTAGADDNTALDHQSRGSTVEVGLTAQWLKALGGDPTAQQRWRPTQCGRWRWQSEGALLEEGGDWASLQWLICDTRKLTELKNFLLEVDVSGKADAAGLSFGDFKDFLAPLKSSNRTHRIQLEIDVEMGCWAFRIDGRLQERHWWNSAADTVEDLVTGILTLKAKGASEVLFQNLTCRTFHSSCRLSVITTCYRFLQRLRISLRNWCHQDLPPGSYEVLVVNPESPDGTHEHLSAVSISFPHIRVREVAVGSDLAKNKGAMINRAIAASRGEWVWLTDADCLFASGSARWVLEQVRGETRKLFYGQRRFLTSTQTAALLSGRADGIRDFDDLALEATIRSPENVPGVIPRLHTALLSSGCATARTSTTSRTATARSWTTASAAASCRARSKGSCACTWTTRSHGGARTLFCERPRHCLSNGSREP
jgi:hypothetical protein